MAILGALSTGRSGVVASGAALSVIGNNIANVQTVGFKGSRTEFADLLAAESGGDAGKIGLGVRIGDVRTLFTQGAIESTGRSLDLGIEGDGFFVLRDGALGRVYSRAGNFQLAADGRVTNLAGNVLQGTPVDGTGTPTGAITDVTVAGVNSQARATTTVDVVGNLQSDAATGTFDGTSFQTAFATSAFPTTVQVYDSLGKAHSLHLFFTRTGTNAWTVNAAVDAGETGGTAGALNVRGTAALTFNTDGTLAGPASLAIAFTGANRFAGAADQTVTLDLGTPGTVDGLSQYASASGFTSQTQDGYGAGQPISLGVDENGILSATFDNGQVRQLFQLAMAKFIAPEGLRPVGDAVFHETLESGQPTIGVAGAQGNGSIVSAALEQSNVQIAEEFIDLISTQRSFQANARVISTGDALLNELVNIIR
jgi:flagellar hook protein FlgE